MINPSVAIIILNWNGWKDTIECLESLSRISSSNYHIILTDNGSEDESVKKIRDYCGGIFSIESKYFVYNESKKPIKLLEYSRLEAEIITGIKIIKDQNRTIFLIKNERNFGFAEGNNVGIRFALNALNPDYILLLNNDTVVHPEFLTELVKTAEMDTSIAFAGPKVYYYDNNGRSDVIDFVGGKIWMTLGLTTHIGRGEIDRGQYNKIKTVGYIEGSCLLAKKIAIEKIGFLDSNYFLYWEETDWCQRARNAGYGLIFVPEAKIWHKGANVSYGKTKTYYLTRNRFIFMRKHGTKIQFALFLVFFFLIYFWYFSGVLVAKKELTNSYMSFLRGILDGLRTY